MSALDLLSAVKEAVASVALSHDADCGCLTCRAAAGDTTAFALILAHVAGVGAPRESEEGQP